MSRASWKPMIWIVVSLLLIGLAGCFSKRITSYSETCPRCLAHLRGVKKELFGITYSNIKTTNDADFLARIDQRRVFNTTQFFAELLGNRCEHVFIAQGKCVYSAAMVSCYAGNAQYFWRIGALRELCKVYQIVPDKNFARQTYQTIDTAQAIGTKWEGGTLMYLQECLPFVGDTNDWQEVLASGPDWSSQKFLVEERMLRLLDNTNETLRARAFDWLGNATNEGYWAKIGELIPDAQLGSAAIRRVLEQRHFPLYKPALRELAITTRKETPEMWRYWPYSQQPWVIALLKNLSETDIQYLLTQNERGLDAFCFAAIACQQKVQYLDKMVAILNKRSSAQAQVAVEELIAGPSPFEPRDPRDWKSSRTYPVPVCIPDWSKIPFNGKPQPELWKPLHDLFEQFVTNRSEREVASVAQAMGICDRAQTRSYLLAEFKKTTDARQRACLLAAMGAVADPAFLPELEKLYASPSHPVSGDIPPQAICLDYALHRCRGIDQWILQSTNKQFRLIKPDHNDRTSL